MFPWGFPNPSTPTTSCAPTTAAPAPGSASTGQQSDLAEPCEEIADRLPGPLGAAAEGVCDVGGVVTDPVGAAGAAVSGVVGKAAEEFADAWGRGIALNMSWWYRTPLTGSTSTDSTAGIVAQTHAYLRFFQIVVFVVSLGIAVVRVALASAQQRGHYAREAAQLMARSLFVSASLVGMVVLADDALRQASVWLLETMISGNASEAAEKLVKAQTLHPLLGSGLLFVFALLGVVGTVVQMVFILIQIAVSKLVLGILPLAASASGTEAGMQAYRKLVAWTLVFLLFPFVSAIAYGVSISLAQGAQDAQGTLAGMVLLTLACLTLPALVRLIVPMAGQMAGGSGAAAAGGLMMATGAVPVLTSTLGTMQAVGGEAAANADGDGSSGGEGSANSATGAVPVPSAATGADAGGGGGGGKSGSESGGGGLAGASGATSAEAGSLLAGAGGPIAMAAGAATQRLDDMQEGMTQVVADGAQNATGSPNVPDSSPGPSGSVPPGGRSDGTN
ncbi:hypothetical protein ACTD5D_40020 [Nocardia takedensis]|uniref:hypothetical protein n=1 Tax=Nocardia takedensis TaxID=259390 RepID=UPI003F758176